jgi:phage terminase large subunit GpA-like protein
MIVAEQIKTLLEDFRNSFRAARPRAIRPISQFAEEEIRLYKGPAAGRFFKIDRQPFSRLWFDLIESGKFQRYAITGPVQSGKTLLASVIPVMYYLFEMQEDVIFGIPSMAMAKDKWEQDFRPFIKASRYASLMPKKGQGHKGGPFESITFENGVTFKFMSAKGDDAKRSGYTGRVLVMTEVDKYDEASESSDEGDPVSQMLARLKAHRAEDTIVFMEATPSTDEGRVWQEYINGSGSRIATPCPHCSHYVTLEREDLIGWQDATTEVEASIKAAFACPACGGLWSRDQRKEANRLAKLVHRGQEILPEGTIYGSLPETFTAGFRWNAANNVIKDAGDFATEEFRAKRSPNPETAEKVMLQFTWAKPWTGQLSTEQIDVTERMVASRLYCIPQGVLPKGTETLVVHIDVHKRNHYWTVLAGRANSIFDVVDYGIMPTPYAGEKNPQEAILAGLRAVRKLLEDKDWVTVDGDAMVIDVHLVDAGYEIETGLLFTRESGKSWYLIKGEGTPSHTKYNQPKQSTKEIWLSDHWHFAMQPAGWWLIKGEADHWMRCVHNGLATAPFREDGTRNPGSIVLYGSDPTIHTRNVDRTIARSSFAAQLVAWKWEPPDERTVTCEWVPQYSKDGRDDHFFDNMYNCLIADRLARALRVHAASKTPAKPVSQTPVTTEDGRAFLVTQR